MSDDIRRKKKKQTKNKTKAEDAEETKPAFVIEEKIAKVSKKTAKEDSESKPVPAPAKSVSIEKRPEQSTANVFSKLVFFVSILGNSKMLLSFTDVLDNMFRITGFIGVAVLTSTGQMAPLQTPALASLGTASLLPNLQNIDLDLGAVERLVTDLRTRLPTSDDVAATLEEMFVMIKSYVNAMMTGDDTNAEKSIVTKSESEDTHSKDISHGDDTIEVRNVKQTESSEDEGEK